MEDKQLNSAQSLELIGRMIAQTRTNFERGSGTAFLIWGYTTVIITIAITSLIYFTHNYLFNWFWWAIPVIGWTLMLLSLRKQEKAVRTIIDRIIGSVWLVIGGSAFLIPLIQFFNNSISHLTLPLEILVLSLGVIISGLILRFTPLIVGGIISFAIAFALLAFKFDFWVYVSLVLVMFTVSMIIPGHILNYRAKRQCSKS